MFASWWNPLSWASSAVGGVVDDLFGGIVKSLAAAIAALVNSLFGWASSIGPNYTQAGFSSAYNVVTYMSLTVAMLVFIASIGPSIWRNPAQLGWGVGRLIVFVGTVWLIPGLAQLAVGLGDGMANEFLGANGDAMASMFSGLLTASIAVDGGFGGGLVATALVLVIAFIMALFLAILFLVRSVGLYVLVFFSPLAYAAWIHKPWQGSARKMGRWFAAGVLMKPVVFGCILLGSTLTSSVGTDGIGAMLSGVALLFIATLAPFALLPLLGELGEHAAQLGQSVRSGASTAAGGLGSATGGVRQLASKAGGSGSGSGSGGASAGGSPTVAPPSGGASSGGSSVARVMAGAAGGLAMGAASMGGSRSGSGSSASSAAPTVTPPAPTASSAPAPSMPAPTGRPAVAPSPTARPSSPPPPAPGIAR